MRAWIAAFVLLCTAWAQARTVAPGEAAEQGIRAPRGAFVRVDVVPEGMMPKATVLDPRGRVVVLSDLSLDRDVPRPVSFIAVQGGTYRLRVAPGETVRAPGRFEVKVEVHASPSSADRMRLAADADLREGMRLQEVWERTAQGKARRLLQRALAGYRGLGDTLWEAEALLCLADSADNLGDLRVPVAFCEKAVALRERTLGAGHVLTAGALRSLVRYRRRAGQAGLEPLARRVHEIFLAARGADSPDVADSLAGLSSVAYADDREVEGLALSRESLAAAERAYGAMSPRLCVFLENLGEDLLQRRESAEAEGILRRALALAESEERRLSARERLGRLLMVAGRFDEGERLFREALAARVRTAPGSPVTAFSMVRLARAYRTASRAEDGVPLLRRALVIERAWYGPGHPIVADVYVDLANAASIRGDLGEAVRLHALALGIYEKAWRGPHSDVSSTLVNLGHLYDKLGNTKRAEPLLLRALAMVEAMRGAEHPEVAAVLNSLGVLYDKPGTRDRAVRAHRRALAIRERFLPPLHDDIAESLNNLALALMASGSVDEAVAMLERSVAINEKLHGRYSSDAGIARNNLAVAYGKKGDREGEARELKLALEIDERVHGPDHPDVATTLQNLLKVELERGDLTAALPIFERQVGIHDKAMARVLLSGSEEDKKAFLGVIEFETFMALSLARRDARYLPVAVSCVLQRKARALDAMANSLEVLRRRMAPEDRKLLDRYGAVREQLSRVPADARAALEEEAGRLEDEISRRSARFQAALRPVTLEAIQARIPEDGAVVEIVRHYRLEHLDFGDEYYSALVIRHSGAPVVVELATAARIDAAVQAARRSFSRPRSTDWAARSRALHDLVIGPLPLAGVRRLLVAPDDRLNLVPFAALQDADGTFIHNYYSITYLTAASDLLRMGPPSAAPAEGGLAVSDPSFGKGAFAPLPGTAGEAVALAEIFPGMRVLRGAKATEGALKRAAAPPLLHVATHGYFRAGSESPLLRSGLALAGANAGRDGEGGDGLLTAVEVAGLDLDGTGLVTLSACETGLGESMPGDGVHGLRRALVLAGADSQVMSLWKVSDEVTRDLMIALYQRIRAGDERGEALRRVQVAMTMRAATSHPCYWAPFILSGDWRAPNDAAPTWRFPEPAWWPVLVNPVQCIDARAEPAPGGRWRGPLGSADGVRVGAAVRGGGTVERVEADSCVARLEGPPRYGWVTVECRPAPVLEHSWLWPLARSGAALRSTFDKSRVVVDYARVRNADTPETFEAVLGELLEDVAEAAPFCDQSVGTAPVAEGYFKGKTMREAFEATKRFHMIRFLTWAGNNPDSYARTTWKLAEVYATWILNGTP